MQAVVHLCVITPQIASTSSDKQGIPRKHHRRWGGDGCCRWGGAKVARVTLRMAVCERGCRCTHDKEMVLLMMTTRHTTPTKRLCTTQMDPTFSVCVQQQSSIQ